MFNDDPTREKIVLMAFPTGGNAAPAATATNPAIKAYSMRSCPGCLSTVLTDTEWSWLMVGQFGLRHTQTRRP